MKIRIAIAGLLAALQLPACAALYSQPDAALITDLLRQKDWEKAEIAIDGALRETPEKEWLYTNQSWVCQNLQKWEKSIRMASTAIQKWPTSENARIALARTRSAYATELQKQGQRQAAHKEIAAAYKTFPRDWYYFQLGASHRDLGEYEQALTIMLDGQRKYPDYPQFAESLPYTRYQYYKSIEAGASPAVLRRWVEETFAYFKKAEPEHHHLSVIRRALRRIGDIAYLENVYGRLSARFPGDATVQDLHGFDLYVTHRLKADVPPAVRARAIALRRKAFQTYTSRHGRQPAIHGLPFPLKGRYAVWAEFGGTAMTHNGFGNYCYDFSAVDEQDRKCKQPANCNYTDYFMFGKPIYAVGDGKVVDALDSEKDNAVGGYEARANTVTLDHGAYTSFYAHLKQGSLRVRKGQQVRAGQLLGQAGNSGMSVEPHLHFCLRDKNEVASLPYHFLPAIVWKNGASRSSTDFYKEGEVVVFE
jgi:tetratricopeptide (TPR) repeat protein